MKGNWVGAGLYTAGAITSLIPGMQGISGVLSVSAMGQSIHQDLKRDAKNENINIEGTGDNVEINGMNNNNYNNLGVIEKPQPIINVVQPKTGGKQVIMEEWFLGEMRFLTFQHQILTTFTPLSQKQLLFYR